MNRGGVLLKSFMVFVVSLSNTDMQCNIIHGDKHRDVTSYQVIIPERVDTNGVFLPYPALHHNNKIANGGETVQFYKIPVGNDYITLQLNQNQNLISSNAVIKKLNKKHVKLKNQGCYCSGSVKGDNFSKVALSTCDGLAGFIRTKRGDYLIEPVKNQNHFQKRLHVLYKHKYRDKGSGSCSKTVKRENNADVKNPQSNPSALYIETLIVVDRSLCSYYEESSWENYILTIFNMAFTLLHDASLDLLVFLSVVRIIQIDVNDKEMNIKKSQNVTKLLENFQEWQSKINPGDDSHPNHHDVAVLITRSDICLSNATCGVLGLTNLASACDVKKSAAVTFENGLRTGFVLAHQIAHLLGAEHDSSTNNCSGSIPDGVQTIMNPFVDIFAETWSKCTRAYIRTFMESDYGKCLLEKPFEHNFNRQSLLPGVMFNADFQCRHVIFPKSRECDVGSTCDSLNCFVPGLGCIKTKTPPATGTRCGENMWCFGGKCIMIGQRPGAIDGNWGRWSAWSECSRTCGSGIASSERRCNKPGPSHLGKYCVGPRKRYRICAALPCPPGTSFRDIQCGEFNDWIYPEDKKAHVWREFYNHNENPCKLFCINDKKEIAALRARVLDGTECYRGIRDVCVEGTCKTIPCDLEFDSKAIEDVCGVCHGDGTTCELVTGTQFFEKGSVTKLLSVPAGTRNINVEEIVPTSAVIVVKDKETKDVYLEGSKLGMFGVPGSQAWLGMIKNSQESLRIPGPVTKPITIWVDRLENVTIRWSMALPLDQIRKPEFAWDFIKWEQCSAYCGPGIQISHPSCVEQKAGLVEDNYCSDLDPPLPRKRPCEIAKCLPRWMVSDWKECKGKNSTQTKRTRKVKCVKSFGEGQAIEKIIPDAKCQTPKPHDTEPCASLKRKKRLGATKFKRHDLFLKSDRKTGVRELVHNKLRRYHSKPEENSLKVKQESEEIFEKSEIRKGVLIIDKDDVSNKQIEVVVEKNEKGEAKNKTLLKVPQNSSVVQLKGKEVYEFLKKLRNIH